MNELRNSKSDDQLEELLLLTEQMQEELDQKDRTIRELKMQGQHIGNRISDVHTNVSSYFRVTGSRLLRQRGITDNLVRRQRTAGV